MVSLSTTFKSGKEDIRGKKKKELETERIRENNVKNHMTEIKGSVRMNKWVKHSNKKQGKRRTLGRLEPLRKRLKSRTRIS